MYFINLDDDFEERYDMSKFMYFDGTVFDVLMSFVVRKLKGFKVTGYYEVTGEEGRPDLVSYKIYGRTMFWWMIMIYNELSDPDQITLGLRLKYPSQDEIEDLYFTLNNQAKAGLNQ